MKLAELKGIEVYVDGGCYENGSQYATAYYSYRVEFISKEGDEVVISKNRVYSPAKTNNQAEYDALIQACRYLNEVCQRMNADHFEVPVTIHSDSQLVIGQMTKGWRCHVAALTSWVSIAKKELRDTHAKLVWVPREVSLTKLGH
jgi:ribonuclease HI